MKMKHLWTLIYTLFNHTDDHTQSLSLVDIISNERLSKVLYEPQWRHVNTHRA